MKNLIFTILGMLIFCGLFAQDIQLKSSQGKHTETCIEIPCGGSDIILIECGKLYRLTIKSCWMSAYARIGTYLISGLNISDPMTGGQPCVLMVAETSSIDWSFSYSLNGSYDANMTITSNGWGDQGLLAVLAELNCGPHSTINEPEIDDLIKIYPNPTKDKINIEFTDNANKVEKLSIFNSLGEMIYAKEGKELNVKIIEIDLSKYKTGIYYLNLKTAAGTLSKKISIVK